MQFAGITLGRPILQDAAGSAPTAVRLASHPPQTVELAAAADRHLIALESDRPATSYLESLYQVQAARHAAALDLAHAFETTALTGGDQSDRPRTPASRISAIRMPIVRDVLRYQAIHERGFLAVGKQLVRMAERGEVTSVPTLFASEEDCIRYLISWQQEQPWSCPSCGDTQRFWSTERRKFESPCGKQYSAYVGTLFAGSHISLVDWFTIIAHVICQPDITSRQIAKHLTVIRSQTIRVIVSKVKAALESDDADRRLAGVNRLVVDHCLKCPGLRVQQRIRKS